MFGLTLSQIITIVGVPSLVTIVGMLIKLWSNTKILMEAIQAQMRKELMADYRKYMTQGYIDDDDMVEWENSYQKYHALGKNGVMDSKREQLIELSNQV